MPPMHIEFPVTSYLGDLTVSVSWVQRTTTSKAEIRKGGALFLGSARIPRISHRGWSMEVHPCHRVLSFYAHLIPSLCAALPTGREAL